jgi:hypothetical protein
MGDGTGAVVVQAFVVVSADILPGKMRFNPLEKMLVDG